MGQQTRDRLAAFFRVGPGRVVERHGAARQSRPIGRRQTGRLALMKQSSAWSATGAVGIGDGRCRYQGEERSADQGEAPAACARSHAVPGVGADGRADRGDGATCRRQRDREPGCGGAKDERPVRPATGRVVCHAREHSTDRHTRESVGVLPGARPAAMRSVRGHWTGPQRTGLRSRASDDRAGRRPAAVPAFRASVRPRPARDPTACPSREHGCRCARRPEHRQPAATATRDRCGCRRSSGRRRPDSPRR